MDLDECSGCLKLKQRLAALELRVNQLESSGNNPFHKPPPNFLGSKPTFGSQTPNFAFGSKPTFGSQTPNSAFGSKPAFGSQAPNSVFGSKSAFGNSTFGSSVTNNTSSEDGGQCQRCGRAMNNRGSNRHWNNSSGRHDVKKEWICSRCDKGSIKLC